MPTPCPSLRTSPRPRRNAHRGARERGAVMVEALIVISLLILGFMGVAFFREYYMRTLLASRLARGSILVYSMTGCGSSNEPAQWIGIPDLARLTAARPDSAERPATGTGTNAQATTSGEGGSVLNKIPGLTSDGRGVMNPITNSDLTGRVQARTRAGLTAPERTIFDNEVRARSFVSCGDPIRNGEFGDVVDYIKGIFF